MKARYQINIHFSDNEYIASVPELGCTGSGSTYQAALADAESAIKQWVTETISAGRPIPAPSSIPTIAAPTETTPELGRKLLVELVTDTYSYRRRLFRSQVGFWERFGVSQSTGSRYERVRQIPLSLAILMGLHAMDRVRDHDLAAVYEMLEPFYPGKPHLRLTSLEKT